MSANPEPLAAILADYRADIPAMTSGGLPHPTPEYLRIMLDRIEAAVKLELSKNRPNNGSKIGQFGNAATMRAALKESTALLAVVRGDEYEENITRQIDRNTDVLSAPPEPPSNAAALREALTAFVGYLTQKRIDEVWAKTTLPEPGLDRLVAQARSALAAPARNCDVGTAQEQIDRFHEFCHSNRIYIDEFHGFDCRPDCPIGKIVDRDNKFCDNCWAAWSQMPFAPAEGGAK